MDHSEPTLACAGSRLGDAARLELRELRWGTGRIGIGGIEDEDGGARSELGVVAGSSTALVDCCCCCCWCCCCWSC